MLVGRMVGETAEMKVVKMVAWLGMMLVELLEEPQAVRLVDK